MFNNDKCDYAVITIGNRTIEGKCTWWSIPSQCTYIKLIIDGKQYITALSNVLLTELEDSKDN